MDTHMHMIVVSCTCHAHAHVNTHARVRSTICACACACACTCVDRVSAISRAIMHREPASHFRYQIYASGSLALTHSVSNKEFRNFEAGLKSEHCKVTQWPYVSSSA